MTKPLLVVVDPSQTSGVGHHCEVNRLLLPALRTAGWEPEVWADVAAEVTPGRETVQGVFSGCGYGDPLHWQDLQGSLRLARRLEQQLDAATTGRKVQAWLAHSVLPFQMLGLARHLNHAPPARVLLSLMFAPAETLHSDSDKSKALANCRVALSALDRACRKQSHSLKLGFPSRQQEELYQPLLEAVGLTSEGLHPAVVGAGCSPDRSSSDPKPLVLLHWGDLKAGKGRKEALEVLQQLMECGVPEFLRGWGWLFQHYSAQELEQEERQLLERAQQELPLDWIEGEQSSEDMVNWLARCPVALLAYCPQTYGQRSSGILWQWASARTALELPAVVVGHAGSWISLESELLGIRCQTSEGGRTWLEQLVTAAEQSREAHGLSIDGATVLKHSFGSWCAQSLKGHL